MTSKLLNPQILMPVFGYIKKKNYLCNVFTQYKYKKCVYLHINNS